LHGRSARSSGRRPVGKSISETTRVATKVDFWSARSSGRRSTTRASLPSRFSHGSVPLFSPNTMLAPGLTLAKARTGLEGNVSDLTGAGSAFAAGRLPLASFRDDERDRRGHDDAYRRGDEVISPQIGPAHDS
jgi:hypothetical protein